MNGPTTLTLRDLLIALIAALLALPAFADVGVPV